MARQSGASLPRRPACEAPTRAQPLGARRGGEGGQRWRGSPRQQLRELADWQKLGGDGQPPAALGRDVEERGAAPAAAAEVMPAGGVRRQACRLRLERSRRRARRPAHVLSCSCAGFKAGKRLLFIAMLDAADVQAIAEPFVIRACPSILRGRASLGLSLDQYAAAYGVDASGGRCQVPHAASCVGGRAALRAVSATATGPRRRSFPAAPPRPQEFRRRVRGFDGAGLQDGALACAAQLVRLLRPAARPRATAPAIDAADA